MRHYNYDIRTDVLQEHGISVEGNPEAPDIEADDEPAELEMKLIEELRLLPAERNGEE